MKSKQPLRIDNLFWPMWLVFSAGCMPAKPPGGPVDSAPLTTATKNKDAHPQAVLTDPRLVIARAVQSMGGESALKRLLINQFSGRGQMVTGNAPSAYRFQTQNILPDRAHELIEYPQDQVTITSVVNKDLGWTMFNRELKEMDQATVKSWQDLLHVNYVMTLAPVLLPPFTLTSLSEQRKEGVLCLVVVVKCQRHRDVTFFFDKETFLPLVVKTAIFDTNRAQELDQEILLREYRDFSGLKYPSRWVVYLNGNKMQEFMIDELKLPAKIDDSVFSKPR